MNVVIILALMKLSDLSDGARILAYMPIPSYSHQVVYRPLWRELSLRGHNITLITTNPIKDPTLTNLTEIDFHFSYKIMAQGVAQIINSKANAFKAILLIVDLLTEILDEQMRHPFIQNLIADASLEFDIFIIESLLAPQVALGKRFGCPVVGLTTLPALETLNTMMGVPTHPILYPDVLLPFEKAETLSERITSTVYHVFVHLLSVYVDPIQDLAIERYFGKEFGTASDLQRNVSLLFVNSNPVLDSPRPMVPAVIQVGGIHRVPPKPLSKALQAILDSATEGCIYFSLGSNVKSKEISLETREILLEAFSELPYTVLWKFELDELPNKPKNVVISKWFQQTDILSKNHKNGRMFNFLILEHPNVKLFITQGGLQSIEEGIYECIPMVGIPVYADQLRNVQKMVRKGFGLSVELASLEKEHFKKTVLEVIENPKYRHKVNEISQLALDQPLSGLEQAVWWVEYLIRRQDVTHLQSPLRSISWWKYLLLDVIAFFLVSTVLCIYVLCTLIRFTIAIMKRLVVMQRKQKLT